MSQRPLENVEAEEYGHDGSEKKIREYCDEAG